MANMFANCYNLFTIPNLKYSNVTDMGGMFNGSGNIGSVTFDDTSKCKFFNATF
jgi:hypothetical protein